MIGTDIIFVNAQIGYTPNFRSIWQEDLRNRSLHESIIEIKCADWLITDRLKFKPDLRLMGAVGAHRIIEYLVHRVRMRKEYSRKP